MNLLSFYSVSTNCCCLEKPNENCNTRLQFKQSIENKVYLEHLYDLFKNFCGTKPLVMSKFDTRPDKNKEYHAIKFKTLSLPCFNVYRELFYDSKGIKVLPINLENMLTPKGLAY